VHARPLLDPSPPPGWPRGGTGLENLSLTLPPRPSPSRSPLISALPPIPDGSVDIALSLPVLGRAVAIRVAAADGRMRERQSRSALPLCHLLACGRTHHECPLVLTPLSQKRSAGRKGSASCFIAERAYPSFTTTQHTRDGRGCIEFLPRSRGRLSPDFRSLGGAAPPPN
jgi:hypothetical protein